MASPKKWDAKFETLEVFGGITVRVYYWQDDKNCTIKFAGHDVIDGDPIVKVSGSKTTTITFVFSVLVNGPYEDECKCDDQNGKRQCIDVVVYGYQKTKVEESGKVSTTTKELTNSPRSRTMCSKCCCEEKKPGKIQPQPNEESGEESESTAPVPEQKHSS